MSTTLIEARTALHKLSGQFPAPSTYSDLLATISDYFDNQVPLNVENKTLLQRVKVLEAAIEQARKILPGDKVFIVPAPSKSGIRKGIDCTAWMGCGKCSCPACKVGVHA
jgi:hypothetical protein